MLHTREEGIQYVQLELFLERGQSCVGDNINDTSHGKTFDTSSLEQKQPHIPYIVSENPEIKAQ